VPIKMEIKSGFKWVLRTCTLSPHLVTTLCRIRFVPTLCPYALSKAKEQANVPAPRSLPMRLGARGLRGVLMRRMGGERYRRGRRFPRSGLSVRPIPGCTVSLASISSRYSERKVGRAVPVTPLRGVTASRTKEPNRQDAKAAKISRQFTKE
jgi:hypothetical protein